MNRKAAEGLEGRMRQAMRFTQTLSYARWAWGEALALDGVWAAATTIHDAEGMRWVTEQLRTWIAATKAPYEPAIHVAPGRLLAEVGAREDEEAWRLACKALGERYGRVPIDAGTGCPCHRDDVPAWRQLAWVDAMYYDGPFLAAAGQLLGRPAWWNRAGAMMAGYVAALWDAEAELLAHYYDGLVGRHNGIHWARGNGWALLGLVDMAAVLPPRHWARAWAREYIVRLVHSLVRWQQPSGLWRTVLDDAQAYEEGSLAAMFVAAVGKAARMGLLTAVPEEAWRRAWAALQPLAAADGACQGMSAVTPWGDDMDHYRSIGFAVSPWGQGAWLRAATEIWLQGALTS